MKTPPLRPPALYLVLVVFSLCVFAAEPVRAASVIYEEDFTTPTPQNLSFIGWQGYAGSGAANITTVAASNTAYLGNSAGNPNTTLGYLALILGSNAASPNENRYPEYGVFESGFAPLDLTGATITWTMSGGTGATVRTRLLVQVNGNWYASNTSDTLSEYYVPSLFGTGAEFAAAPTASVTKSFAFTLNAGSWRSFSLTPGTSMSLGSVLSTDLSSEQITGIGFYVVGGNTGRLDTLTVTSPVPEPSMLSYAGITVAGMVFLMRRSSGRRRLGSPR